MKWACNIQISTGQLGGKQNKQTKRRMKKRNRFRLIGGILRDGIEMLDFFQLSTSSSVNTQQTSVKATLSVHTSVWSKKWECSSFVAMQSRELIEINTVSGKLQH